MKKPAEPGFEYPEVITTEERLDLMFTQANVENVLRSYAFRESEGGEDPVTTSQDDVDDTLMSFASSVADLAFNNGDIDIATVRVGFDKVFSSMNKVGNEKLGPRPPRTLGEGFLILIGVKQPTPIRRFAGLDDRYWSVQFTEQYKEEAWVKRNPEDTEQQYFARYTAMCMHHFALAPYSYI